MKTPHDLLALGVQKGFAGETEFSAAKRAGFALQASHFQEGEDLYHDEWSADRTGGGQELVQIGEKKYTRVYAGGTISVAEIAKLGITKKEVMVFLIECLNEFGAKTRGQADFTLQKKGEWGYQYHVLEKNDAIPMTTGKEEIFYRDQIVFVHVFVMCPVE